MELQCQIQKYDWGKRGSASKVATLVKSKDKYFEIEENSPYAELWMGTHVNGPSIIKRTGQSLSNYITDNPKSLGEKVAKTFNNQLPFLLKVLSINTALSIQAHPTKKHAQELHAKRPDIYKDPNHKPELAIALTPFEAMCGFRPVEEVKWFITNILELEEIIGSCKSEENDEEFLKKCFRLIVTCEKEKVKNTVIALQARYKNLDKLNRAKYLADLVDHLNEDFPYDNGILMIYLLNYIKLNPSESLFLGANEVHAYLYGDCVEIMASSDNVVRAGLTPKLVDVETLCSMLIYKGEKPEDKIFQPIIEDDYTHLYKPSVPDFAIAEIQVPCSVKNYKTIRRNSASIIIVISGRGKSIDTELQPGTILFLGSDEVLHLVEVFSEGESMLMYQGFANVP